MASIERADGWPRSAVTSLEGLTRQASSLQWFADASKTFSISPAVSNGFITVRCAENSLGSSCPSLNGGCNPGLCCDHQSSQSLSQVRVNSIISSDAGREPSTPMIVQRLPPSSQSALPRASRKRSSQSRQPSVVIFPGG